MNDIEKELKSLEDRSRIRATSSEYWMTLSPSERRFLSGEIDKPEEAIQGITFHNGNIVIPGSMQSYLIHKQRKIRRIALEKIRKTNIQNPLSKYRNLQKLRPKDKEGHEVHFRHWEEAKRIIDNKIYNKESNLELRKTYHSVPVGDQIDRILGKIKTDGGD